MLSENKIIGIFCLVDDLLKGIRHKEDSRRRISDSEVITTALVSALYFGGHIEDHGRHMMKMTGMVPQILDKSRFCRRLHSLETLLCSLFFQIGHRLKTIAGASDYLIYSFPVAVCDNIRIGRCKLLKGEQWRGKCSMGGISMV